MERKMLNNVVLAGYIDRFEKDKVTGKNWHQGVTKNGKEFLSFKGMIVLGENTDYAVRFTCYINATKVDGTPSKLYAPALEWVQSAVAKADNPDNPTFVEMLGSLSDNPYKDPRNPDSIIEYVEYSVTRFRPFTEFKAEIDIDGYICSINDEMDREENETGRQIMKVLTTDSYNKTVELRKVVIPEEIKQEVAQTGWEPGCTAHIAMNLVPRTEVRAGGAVGGFGTPHRAMASEYTVKEFVVCAGDPPYDDERAITPEKYNAMTEERRTRLFNIKNGETSMAAVGSRTSLNGSGATITKEQADKAEMDW